jgi:hypothetical protein
MKTSKQLRHELISACGGDESGGGVDRAVEGAITGDGDKNLREGSVVVRQESELKKIEK